MSRGNLTIQRQYDRTFIEMAERGKDIEKIFRILCECKSQIQDPVVKKMWDIFRPYVLRNTPECHSNIYKTLHKHFAKKNKELSFMSAKHAHVQCKKCKDKDTPVCQVCVFES